MDNAVCFDKFIIKNTLEGVNVMRNNKHNDKYMRHATALRLSIEPLDLETES